jgi:predicted Zn-dependent protease
MSSSPIRPSSSSVRLTRRGRAMLVLLVAAVAFLAFSIGRVASQAGTEPTGSATRAVTVQPGQTLWQLAVQVAPQDDPRATVDRIRELNDMRTEVLQAGQRLVVPA